MKRPPNPPIPGQMLERSQDLFEILGEIMGKLDLLAGKLSKMLSPACTTTHLYTERIEGIECQLNMQEKCEYTYLCHSYSNMALIKVGNLAQQAWVVLWRRIPWTNLKVSRHLFGCVSCLIATATISVPHPTAITIVNHATPRHGSQMRVNPTIGMEFYIFDY